MGNILASHRLAHMSAKGIGIPKQCTIAVSHFKNVAERGDWMTQLTNAHVHYISNQWYEYCFF